MQDLNGLVPRFFFFFFQFRGHLIEFANDLDRVTAEQAIELLRKEIVASMRTGDTFAMNLGTQNISFKELQTPEMPFDSVFDFKKGRSKENYIKLVRQNEKFNKEGIKRKFDMHQDFKFVLICQNHDQDIVNEVLRNLPHSIDFEKIIFE